MDTKLKKSKPFKTWLAFFLAISIIISLLVTGLAILEVADGNFDALRSPFVDYKESYAFKSRTASYFNGLFSLAINNSMGRETYLDMNLIGLFEAEGENLKYWAADTRGSFRITNIPEDYLQPNSPLPNLPPGYDYYWCFDGKNFSITKKVKKWIITDWTAVIRD